MESTDTCNAKRKGGSGLCDLPAGHGTDHYGFGRCSMHGGMTPHGRAFGYDLMVHDEARRMAIPLDVDPQEALAELVRVMAGQVAWFTNKVLQLSTDEMVEMNEKTGVLETSVWIRAHAAAVDRLMRASKMALDAGVAERKIRVMEEQGRWLTNTLDQVFTLLELTPSQVEALPRIMMQVLANVQPGSSPIIDVSAEVLFDSADEGAALPAPTPW